MSECQIDHIAVTSPSLEKGAQFIKQRLGVMPEAGGAHPRMGTHNLLVSLGESLYLEVIAPDPAAPSPDRPRWFALDNLHPDSPPALSAWVARTTDINAAAYASLEPLGNIESMSRGTLNWLITIPANGSIPLDGVGPALIEWHTDIHPASKLQDLGLSLNRLEIFHPDPARVSRFISSIGLDGPISLLPPAYGEAPHLVAHINTPHGICKLSNI